MKIKIIIAKKPCSFNGQQFFIGNTIPSDYVLDPKSQISMGVIEVVEVESGDAAPEEGGQLLPPSSTLEDEELENPEEEEESEDSDNQEEESHEETKYSKSVLVRMTKDELIALATGRGIVTGAEMTKEAIADLIVEQQGD